MASFSAPNGCLNLRVHPHGPAPVEEWVMLDLQGELATPAGRVEGPQPQGLQIGPIRQSAVKKDALELFIANHQLDGARQQLARPFAVLAKSAPQGAAGGGEGEGGKRPLPEYTVAGVVRSRYVFRNRPRILMGQELAAHKAQQAVAVQ